MCGIRWVRIGLMVAASGLAPALSMAGPLDPSQFGSLGALSLTTPGTGVITTTGAAPVLSFGGTGYVGVYYNGIAVFDFTSINIGAGVTLATSGGGAPVALLSRTTASIGGTINVSAITSIAGPGAADTGPGGLGGLMSGQASAGGGGGGFGGAGGMGGSIDGLQGGAGGLALANLANVLQGGSRGGGPGSFGAGGGAIEIGALQGVSLSGEVDAVGGAGLSGGGGSGGGIFIHAADVAISGTLNVQGGAGGPGFLGQAPGAGSGGGGGGEILVDFSTFDPATFGGTILTSGGMGGLGPPGSGTPGSAGSKGQVIYGVLAVPEPSSLILLGTSTLGLLGASTLRRKTAPQNV